MPDFSTINLDTHYELVEHALFTAKIKSVMVELGKAVSAETADPEATPSELAALAHKKAVLLRFTEAQDHWLRVLRPKLAVLPTIAALQTLIQTPNADLTNQQRDDIGNAIYTALEAMVDYYSDKVSLS